MISSLSSLGFIFSPFSSFCKIASWSSNINSELEIISLNHYWKLLLWIYCNSEYSNSIPSFIYWLYRLMCTFWIILLQSIVKLGIFLQWVLFYLLGLKISSFYSTISDIFICFLSIIIIHHRRSWKTLRN